ncbi:MAG TPA: hypothetical protein VIV11_33695 [Kofleriaceae bacterium]
MDREFWQSRWHENQIGFHEGIPNRFLLRYADRLEPYRRILVPLCGKADDLSYLAAHEHDVIGIELVEDAVRQFFAEHALTPTVTPRDGLTVYTAERITIIAGDFFATTSGLLGKIDAIYDRAALVALPPDMRTRYAAHLRTLAPNTRTALLVSIEYPAGSFEGPPFSVPASELRTLYPDAELEKLDEAPDPRGRAGGKMIEHCYELRF